MENINTKQILNILKPQWKKLTIIVIIAAVLGAFFSSPLFIKSKYKSSAVIYPTNLVNFGAESTTEQLLQFLNSEEIKHRLTKRFNLYEHYEIDSTSKYAVSKFNEVYNTNISINNTLYESIEIEVIDVTPKFAQTLCKAVIDEGNFLIRKLKQEKVDEYLGSYSNQLKLQQQSIDSLEAKLRYFRSTYGILDYVEQTKSIYKHMGKRGLTEEEKNILKNLKEYGGEFILLQNKLGVETSIYKDLKANFDKNKLDQNGNLSYSTIVSKPNLPDKKCSPNRLFIVALFSLSSFLMAAVVILVTSKKQGPLA